MYFAFGMGLFFCNEQLGNIVPIDMVQVAHIFFFSVFIIIFVYIGCSNLITPILVYYLLPIKKK